MTVHDDAAAALRARLDALPGSRRLTAEQLEVIYAMAYAHVARCEYGKALPIFAFLAQYGPTRKHYWAGLALCLQKTDRPDEARNLCVDPHALSRFRGCRVAHGRVRAGVG